MLGIVGKSGSGKTTLLKCIYGLEDMWEGEVLLDDERVLGPAYNLIPGHENMKLVSQDFYVLDNHSVQENIFDKLIGYTQPAKEKRADKILKLLELTQLKNTRAKNLSSGQKQRVAIARALAIIPKILLLDEPFSNLDKLLNEKLFSFVTKEAKKNNTAIILITHLSEEALKYADTIAIMDNGRLMQSGSKWDVYYKPKNSKLAGLLGAHNTLKKEDLEKTAKIKLRSKLFLRPDKLKLSASKRQCDLLIEISACTFNGKCYELLCETKNHNPLIIYSNKELVVGNRYPFIIVN